MVNAGRILIITKGTWDSLVSYEQLDLVTYNQIAYIARQASVGVNPANDTSMTYWQPFGSAASIATTTAPGLVMPDGDTIKIDATGLIWVELDADAVGYDGTSSGLSATDVQNAIDQAVALAKAAMTGIAPIESSSTASQAYNVGDLFFYNGKLYVCTLAFAQGAMIIPNINCSETTISAQISSLNTAIANKANTADVILKTDIANNLTTSTAGKVLDATQGLALANKHKVTRFEVSITGWSSDTTSQSGTTLYKKSISLNHAYVDVPTVDIGATGVLPTSAQQTAYDLLQYVTIDGTTLYLYANAIPTTAFYINVEGVD